MLHFKFKSSNEINTLTSKLTKKKVYQACLSHRIWIVEISNSLLAIENFKDFEDKCQHGLELEIGETVHIFEEYGSGPKGKGRLILVLGVNKNDF